MMIKGTAVEESSVTIVLLSCIDRPTYFTMNKLLIVLLAVCLVSTHAFVKRDAPATTDLQKQLADLQAQLLELGKSVTDQTAAALSPENIKNELDKAIAAAKEVVDKFKPATTEETKPAA